jgi:hypothetical protein
LLEASPGQNLYKRLNKTPFKEKEVRRNKYSKYIYELALPIELDRQELRKEAAR